MSELIESKAALAKALNRSRQALDRNWLSHDCWAWNTSPPWKASDVPSMEAWAREWLRDGGEETADRNNVDGFWNHHLWEWRAPVECPMESPLMVSKDYQSYPSVFASDFEKDVLAGRRTMNADEVHRYVRTIVHDRVLLTDLMQNHLPQWLTRESESEITARIRAVLFERFGYQTGVCRWMGDAQDGIERDDDGKIIKQRKPRVAAK